MVCMHVFTYVCMCMYVCITNKCMYVGMYACMHAHMYVHKGGCPYHVVVASWSVNVRSDGRRASSSRSTENLNAAVCMYGMHKWMDTYLSVDEHMHGCINRT